MTKALYSDSITLHLMDEDNPADVCLSFQGHHGQLATEQDGGKSNM